MARYQTYLDDSVGLGASAIAGISTQGSIWGVGLTPFTGGSAEIAIIADKKAQYVLGGTFNGSGGENTNTVPVWQTRDLNTEISDRADIVTVSSNQFVLGIGTYYIDWHSPAIGVGTHQTRLYDVTNGVQVETGTVGFTTGNASLSVGYARTSVNADTTFEIQHCGMNTHLDVGYGGASPFTEGQFTTVKIERQLDVIP